MSGDPVNILLVDDQPAKLLSYEVVLQELDLNILKATSARDAFAQLLATDVAIVLMDVSMPELDGFQLAGMIREHPRFQRTAIIFVSGIHLDRVDFLRGYEMGAVDYVTVPVIPEVLRAKVRVFADLYRKTRELEQLNRNLEERVADRTAALEASALRLRESEQRRSQALAAGQMGSWDWDVVKGDCQWDENEYRILGVDPDTFAITAESVRALIHPEDLPRLEQLLASLPEGPLSQQAEFRIVGPDGLTRWCFGTASATLAADSSLARLSGVTIDITERKQAEERQALLAREVDHRAKNALALVQTIIRLSHADTMDEYVEAVEGRIQALSRAHALLAQSRWRGADLAGLVTDELAPYSRDDGTARINVSGTQLFLEPRTAQTLALALHELSTNAAKYGALSVHTGRVSLSWERQDGQLVVHWTESNGPTITPPRSTGFGLRAIAASIERQLDGRAVFDWHPAGLHCTFSLPIDDPSEELALPSSGRTAADGADQPPSPPSVASKRVLLVEDDVLVGLMMQEILADFGCSVVGPFGSVPEALRVAVSEELDTAVLDVNLGKTLVYPVAEALQARAIPFVFLTGYGTDSIDARFASATVLGKPVDRNLLRQFLSTTRPARHRRRREGAEGRESTSAAASR
jgi:two-component sensor histidine kinase/DNA-binding response OmpR family regulator